MLIICFESLIDRTSSNLLMNGISITNSIINSHFHVLTPIVVDNVFGANDTSGDACISNWDVIVYLMNGVLRVSLFLMECISLSNKSSSHRLDRMVTPSDNMFLVWSACLFFSKAQAKSSNFRHPDWHYCTLQRKFKGKRYLISREQPGPCPSLHGLASIKVHFSLGLFMFGLRPVIQGLRGIWVLLVFGPPLPD